MIELHQFDLLRICCRSCQIKSVQEIEVVEFKRKVARNSVCVHCSQNCEAVEKISADYCVARVHLRQLILVWK